MLEGALPGDSVISLGNFPTHMGNNSETEWCCVIGLRKPQFRNNTMFKPKGVQKYSWHQDTIGHRSMVNFVIVSSGLWPYVLDPWVKRGAELC